MSTAHDDATHPHGPRLGHVVPMSTLLTVFGVLLLLTGTTVWAHYGLDLGHTGNLAVALIIAVVKASAVALYFMHLRWDRPMNGIIFISALLFVALFCLLAMLDTTQYAPDLAAYETAAKQGGG